MENLLDDTAALIVIIQEKGFKTETFEIGYKWKKRKLAGPDRIWKKKANLLFQSLAGAGILLAI